MLGVLTSQSAQSCQSGRDVVPLWRSAPPEEAEMFEEAQLYSPVTQREDGKV